MKSKKNHILRAAAALFVVATLCACLFAGNTTLAMYSALATGTSAAEIAKFAVFVGSDNTGDNITDGAITSFPLFSTIQELNSVNGDTAGGTDSHVKTGKIAPGTKGAFEVDVFNDSDVTVKVTVAVTCTGANLGSLNAANNGFSISGGTTLTDIVLAPQEAFSTLATPIAAAARTFTWAWSFPDADSFTPPALSADTQVGILAYSGGATGPTATITVTATQVD